MRKNDAQIQKESTEEGNDPVAVGAHFITCIQFIVARNIKPTEAAVIRFLA